MIFFCSLFALIYFSFSVWYSRGLQKSRAFSPRGESGAGTRFSIIIAARNEAAVIADTLQRLLDQDYPPDRYEIIVAADRCSDGTAEIARAKSADFPALQVIEIGAVPEGVSPKKHALALGIRQAKFGNLILMDADCSAGRGYLRTFDGYFTAGIRLLINIPKVRPGSSLLHRYLLPERLTAWGIAAAAAGHRRPFLAFGGSWAYTRDLLQAAGGFSGISRSLSGDDDLLVYRMGKLRPEMAVCLEPAGWVTTGLPATWKAFFTQRRRHHSAGKYYSKSVQAGYALFHLSNFLLWITPFFYPPGLIVLGLKFLSDYLNLKKTAAVFREETGLFRFLIFEIGYLLHNVLLAPLGFIGKIRWGGK